MITHIKKGDREVWDNPKKKRIVVLGWNVWLGKPLYRDGWLVEVKSYKPRKGGGRIIKHPDLRETRHLKESTARAMAKKMVKEML